jgi:hypothetical protein
VSAKPARGKRTPDLISGRLSNPKPDPKPKQLERVSRAYCARAGLVSHVLKITRDEAARLLAEFLAITAHAPVESFSAAHTKAAA